MSTSHQFSLRHVFATVTLAAIALGVLVRPTGRNVVLAVLLYVYVLGPLFAILVAKALRKYFSHRVTVCVFLSSLFGMGMVATFVTAADDVDSPLAISAVIASVTMLIWCAQYAAWRGATWIADLCIASFSTDDEGESQ